MLNLGINPGTQLNDLLKSSVALPFALGVGALMPAKLVPLPSLFRNNLIPANAKKQDDLHAKARKMSLKEYATYKQERDAAEMGISLVEFKRRWEQIRSEASKSR